MRFSTACFSAASILAGVAFASPLTGTPTLHKRSADPPQVQDAKPNAPQPTEVVQDLQITQAQVVEQTIPDPAHPHSLQNTVIAEADTSYFFELVKTAGYENIWAIQNVTIFAPNNEELFSYTAAHVELFKDKSYLAEFVNVHIVKGVFNTKDIDAGHGSWLETSKDGSGTGGGPSVNAVKGASEEEVAIYSAYRYKSVVTQGNIAFDGGVLHKINTPLTPPATVSETSQVLGLTTFVEGLHSAELIQYVDVTEQVTVFAPNNAAFNAAGKGLKNSDNKAVLSYHVVQETLHIRELVKQDYSVTSTAGGQLKLHPVSEEVIYVNQAQIIVGNVPVKNGVLHVLGGVCNPKDQKGF